MFLDLKERYARYVFGYVNPPIKCVYCKGLILTVQRCSAGDNALFKSLLDHNTCVVVALAEGEKEFRRILILQLSRHIDSNSFVEFDCMLRMYIKRFKK